MKRDFPDMVDPARDALIPALYYNDVRQTDFRLYAESPERARIFALLRRAVPPDDHPMLTAQELSRWRDDQFSFYEGPCPHDAPVRHVDVAYVGRFIARMVPEFDRINGEVFPMTNAVLQAIADRRSNRGYAPRQLTEEELQAILTAALQSPSARNSQPWHFSVVQDAALLKEFSLDLQPPAALRPRPRHTLL